MCVFTFLSRHLLQAGEQLGHHHAVAVVKGQSVGRHRTHIHTLHGKGMLGDVVCCRPHAVIVELGGEGDRAEEELEVVRNDSECRKRK